MSSPFPSPDTITHLAGAQIQHGPYNRRIYLMKLGDAEPETLLPMLLDLCEKNDYTKLFAKVPIRHEPVFAGLGFETEARIPQFFDGTEDAVFMGLYLDSARRESADTAEIEHVRRLARGTPAAPAPTPSVNTVLRCCRPNDTPIMAELYDDVFDTYPFPIEDPAFLAETMVSHVTYFGVWEARQLVALASAEVDREAHNVEMTDFATRVDHRGQGYARSLLARMETAMRKEDILTGYTIARATSPGINITFARQGYEYGGCLINNTNIAGRIESMNVWYRPLSKEAVPA